MVCGLTMRASFLLHQATIPTLSYFLILFFARHAFPTPVLLLDEAGAGGSGAGGSEAGGSEALDMLIDAEVVVGAIEVVVGLETDVSP